MESSGVSLLISNLPACPTACLIYCPINHSANDLISRAQKNRVKFDDERVLDDGCEIYWKLRICLCSRHVPSLTACFNERESERAGERVRKCFGKAENSSESERFSLEIFKIGLKRAGERAERADDAPSVLPTFHRMRVHPKKPISCSLNLGLLMGV